MRFAVVDNGEIINLDQVVKIAEGQPPAEEPYVVLELVNGHTVTASGRRMHALKQWIVGNSI
ncbi:hypothetical protein [Geotalea sp. SG265]|uniref:hypothetical protein n=1 Tax=Geotalea sp. SG265 TaxID=2922867 RepID=UPI001FAFB8E1|nr:hypothetical protein [Geotalea sp. SG265]